MLGIGRPEDGDAARPPQARQGLDQDLGARRRDDRGRVGGAVGQRRGRAQPAIVLGGGQARETAWRQRRAGVRDRVDARREVEPRLGRAGKQRPRCVEIAPVGDRRIPRPEPAPPMSWTDLAHPPHTLPILALALAVEAACGYPQGLYRALGHPVTWIGRLIAALDRGLNRGDARQRRAGGVFALALLLAVVGTVGLGLTRLAALAGLLPGIVILALLAASLPAQRSLHEHVATVAQGLRAEGLAGGRHAVSMIVGRDPETLDEAGVCRAAIESLSENFSDGIVAPAFWIGAGGLAGGVLYKAVNTADSMVGHRTPRHEAFGWASARLDDLVNLPASRLSALLIVAAAALHRDASAKGAMHAVWRDAGRHRSPNAGWPEAAMAGALGLRLAGPRVYGGTRVADAWMGDGRPEATAADVERALRLYRTACLLLAATAAVLAALGLTGRG